MDLIGRTLTLTELSRLDQAGKLLSASQLAAPETVMLAQHYERAYVEIIAGPFTVQRINMKLSLKDDAGAITGGKLTKLFPRGSYLFIPQVDVASLEPYQRVSDNDALHLASRWSDELQTHHTLMAGKFVDLSAVANFEEFLRYFILELMNVHQGPEKHFDIYWQLLELCRLYATRYERFANFLDESSIHRVLAPSTDHERFRQTFDAAWRWCQEMMPQE